MHTCIATGLLIALTLILSHCATVATPPTAVEAPVSRSQQREAQHRTSIPETKILKRKVAIARFSNETRYGKALLRDVDQDPLGKQATDMLSTRLVASKKFLIFERPDLSKIEREQIILKDANLIGVDALILGSITEFGRVTTGTTGFLSATKKQVARAKVEIRLADPRTGHVFFSATGSGEATTESGEVAGFGSRADYDARLNDQAIGAAISDLQNTLISKLEERPWRTDILRVQGYQVFVSGGAHQGLQVGDVFAIMREGDRVTSQQTGFTIMLPGTQIGRLRIISLFGDAETNEGAVGEIIFGTLDPNRLEGVYVAEERRN